MEPADNLLPLLVVLRIHPASFHGHVLEPVLCNNSPEQRVTTTTQPPTNHPVKNSTGRQFGAALMPRRDLGLQLGSEVGNLSLSKSCDA